MLEIYCDGGSRGNPGPAASAIVVLDDGKEVYKNSIFLGKTTNNVAEYNAVILGMEFLSKNNFNEATFVLDSELVASQLSGKFKIKNENLKLLFLKIKNLKDNLKTKIYFRHVLRDKNKSADFLVNLTLDENM